MAAAGLPVAAAGWYPRSSSPVARPRIPQGKASTRFFQSFKLPEKSGLRARRARRRPAFGSQLCTRSAALGCSGAAGTAHPLATQTAIEMLKRGGSAVDAAIAANAMLGFVEPVSSGLGGDCFAFVLGSQGGKLVSMASSGRSPQSLSLATARSRAKNGVLP
jgi:gamma-glutamyltranspeptidase/glutathione hydrolase